MLSQCTDVADDGKICCVDEAACICLPTAESAAQRQQSEVFERCEQ